MDFSSVVRLKPEWQCFGAGDTFRVETTRGVYMYVDVVSSSKARNVMLGILRVELLETIASNKTCIGV